MTAAEAMVSSESAPRAPSWISALLGRIVSLVRFLVGVIFCLTPFTAVFVLGWLMRLMQREEALTRERLQGLARSGRRARLPRWIMAETSVSSKGLARWFGSLIDNVRFGLAALVTIAAGTLPFTLLWLFSWWGGWENSFNKGYEQAWVGPAVGLIGVAASLPLLARLPMALAHQAAEGRLSAFFAWRDVKRLIRGAGWRYVMFSFLFVVAAVPLFVAKSAPVFVEQWSPGFLDRNAAAVQDFAGGYRFVLAVYLLSVLVLLRRAAARLHGGAVLAIEHQDKKRAISFSLGTVLQTLFLWLIWFGLVVQIYVGQFFSHQWLSWLNHPLVELPWILPLGVPL